LMRMGREAISFERVVDTLALARRKHPGLPNSLDALCDRYRIDRSRRVRHGALLDAEILVEVYGELVGGRQRSLIFSSSERMRRAAAMAGVSKERPTPLAPEIGEDELLAHGAHIATLGAGALWSQYLLAGTVSLTA